jgi:hypothetical protein
VIAASAGQRAGCGWGGAGTSLPFVEPTRCSSACQRHAKTMVPYYNSGRYNTSSFSPLPHPPLQVPAASRVRVGVRGTASSTHEPTTLQNNEPTIYGSRKVPLSTTWQREGSPSSTVALTQQTPTAHMHAHAQTRIMVSCPKPPTSSASHSNSNIASRAGPTAQLCDMEARRNV